MRHGFSRLLVLAAAFADLALGSPSGAAPIRSSLPVVLVRVPDAPTAAYVAAHFDETEAAAPGFVEVLLWPGDAARLAARGLDWQVVTPDLLADPRERTGPGPLVALPGPDRTDYRHLADYEAELKDLAAKHPGLVRLVTLPNKTLEGRTVYGIEIAANVGAKDGRPTFLVDGVHHAREWPAGEFPMLYAHQLVEGYGHSKKVTSLLRRLRFYVVPIVNADGFTYSRESPVGDALSAASQGGFWRKNRRSFTGVTAPVGGGTNPDAHGVDPNRNYGFMWGDDIGGSSSTQTDETYRGAGAFSEPEARNIERLLLARPVTALVTNHTYGKLVMHPWGWTDDETPPADEKIFDRIGQRLADAMGGYENWSAIQLYATSGGSRDWAYGALNTLAYTFEHGTAFHPAYETGVGQVWRGVLSAFDIAAEAAADPALHSVLTGTVVDARGRPLAATMKLTKTVVSPLWNGNPSGKNEVTEAFAATTTAVGGAFTWHVNPSVRPQVDGGAGESYLLTISAGSRSKKLRIVVRRGQTLRLGRVTLP